MMIKSTKQVPTQVQPRCSLAPPQKSQVMLTSNTWLDATETPHIPPERVSLTQCCYSQRLQAIWSEFGVRIISISSSRQLRSSSGRPARRASPPAPNDDGYQIMVPSSVGRTLKPPSDPHLSEPCDTQPAYQACVIECEHECERRKMLLSVACSAAVMLW
jgi:hypothetical protein